MFRKLFFILILSSLCLSCSVNRAINKADTAFINGEYYSAAEKYGKVYSRLKGNERKLKLHVSLNRGKCYKSIEQNLRAEAEFKKALHYGCQNDTLYLYLAQAQKHQGKYKEAIKNFEIFLAKNDSNILAKNGLVSCKLITEWNKKRPKYGVGVAKYFYIHKDGFCPVFIPKKYNSLIFSSSDKFKISKKSKTTSNVDVSKKEKPKVSKITGLLDNNFFITKLDKSGKWSKPEFINSSINSEFDEGAACFSPQGNIMYFTRCVISSDSIEKNSRAEIFKSIRSGSSWSKPQKVELLCDSNAVLAHPAVSPDGKYLYFVSNTLGGYGGYDIYRTMIIDGETGVLENLGPMINTKGDEMFPSFRNNGDLYFSSDGLPGYGGLDLFVAIKDTASLKDSFVCVNNLYAPINSSGDDFGITFYGDKDQGFFSSNRKNVKGWDNIYYFEIPHFNIQIKGVVLDRYDEELPDAVIKIVGKDGLVQRITTDKSGEYTINVKKNTDYVMMCSCRSYLNSSYKLHTLDIDKDTTYISDFGLFPIYKSVRMENINFEFDSWKLLESSYASLDKIVDLMLDNPHIVIEIGAHTDRKGEEDYNLKLSSKRAQAVVNYLVSAGVEKERLRAKGYGEKNPTIIDRYMHKRWKYFNKNDVLNEDFINKLDETKQDTADFINRRCEFKVLKTTYKLF